MVRSWFIFGSLLELEIPRNSKSLNECLCKKIKKNIALQEYRIIHLTYQCLIIIQLERTKVYRQLKKTCIQSYGLFFKWSTPPLPSNFTKLYIYAYIWYLYVCILRNILLLCPHFWLCPLCFCWIASCPSRASWSDRWHRAWWEPGRPAHRTSSRSKMATIVNISLTTTWNRITYMGGHGCNLINNILV